MPIDIRRSLKKFAPHFLAARDQNLNEADTVQRLVKFFEQVLGYDAMSEITRERQIKDKYCDLAIKLDGVVKMLIEAKSAATELRDRHIEQAERYAANDNVRWVLLTNGVAWNLYHLTFEEGIESERVFTVDLATDITDKDAACLALLHRQAIRKGEHEEHWRHRLALHPASLAKALFREDILKAVRRDIRKREGLLVEEDDLVTALYGLFASNVREEMGGPPRVRRRRVQRSRDKGVAETPAAATPMDVLSSLPDHVEPA
jgi:predicted type IV restriction endonuclease